MASKPTPPPPTNQRHRFTVEFDVPSDRTPSESVEWVQKWFDFFHPSMKARVTGKPEVLVTVSAEAPETIEALPLSRDSAAPNPNEDLL